MINFTSGLTALWASQAALNTVANNIANAGTPDYHRQVVGFADRTPVEHRDLLIGTGVDVALIRRMRSDVLENALTRNISESADTSRRLDTIRFIESLLQPGSGSLQDRLATFFNELEQLSAAPYDATRRNVALQSAVALTQEFNSLANSLSRLRGELQAEVQETVEQVNLRAAELAELNEKIRVAEGRGLVPNDLLDRRDQLVNELSQLVDARVEDQGQGQTVVLMGVGSLLVGHQAVQLELCTDSDGNLIVAQSGFDEPVPLGGGRLAGLLEAHNQLVPEVESQLASFATGLVGAIDARHATAVGLDGPLEHLQGQRGVSNTSAPLATVDTAFPVQNGSLFISVTDSATGQRALAEVTIDPDTQSLQDVAAAISAVDHLQAVVDPQTRTLQILAEPGYAFDFTGLPETLPDTSGITGSVVPEMHGRYTGDANDQFTFQFNGTGTIGTTAGLTLEVRNGAGQLMATLDVGQGYEPGSPLLIASGISVSLDAGTANAGDTFATRVVGESDTAGLLTALGLNTLFVGQDLTDLEVNPAILQNPDWLATSITGEPGDSAGLLKMIAARDDAVLEGGTQTFEQYLNNLLAEVGTEINTLTQIQDNIFLLGEQLRVERESLSGVDPNEEMVNMLQFQRSFQAAARYIATMDETLEELFIILR